MFEFYICVSFPAEKYLMQGGLISPYTRTWIHNIFMVDRFPPTFLDI